LPLVGVLALAQPVAGTATSAQSGLAVSGNSLVDLDRGLQFPQNKQNEPAITRDPSTGVLIAGANDELDNPLCHDATAPLTSPCPFQKGEMISAYYISKNNGAMWSGGYLPGYGANGIGRASGGDPSLDYGPRLCPDRKTFDFACGVTIYYANLADPISADQHFSEATAVSRTHDDGKTWLTPTIVNAVNKTSDFDDHEWLAVDKTPGNPHFGRAYVFIAIFCGECSGNGNVKLVVVHSDDEGATWSSAVQVSTAAASNLQQGLRETGQMAVAKDGTVEVFWTENADSTKLPSLQVVATSKDGGQTFTNPITIAQVTDYPLTGTPFDAVDLFNRVPGMSARVDCYPHPAADPGSSRVYVVWCDFSGGQGVVTGAVSPDGVNWSSLGTIAAPGRNAFFPQATVDPGGTLDVTFDALTAPPANNPWQTGVQVYDNYFTQSIDQGTTFTPALRVSSASSNPDGSSYNNLQEQFIGDYIGIVSGPGAAYLVWTDSRNATPCAAVDSYRNQIYAGSTTAVAPNPDSSASGCATSFGNTDTYEATVRY
jgi:hypothetical protein